MSLNRPTLLRIVLAIVLLATAWSLRRPGLSFEIWNVDEAVTFTMAQQVLAGEVPYRDAVDQRTPLAPLLQAVVFAATGDWNLPAQHLVLALLIGLVAVLVWQLARAAGEEAVGIAGALWLTLLAFMLPSLRDTMTAHTGWYLIFFSSLGFWLLCRGWNRTHGRGVFLSGACFGLAVLAKQPGVLDFGVALILGAAGAWLEPQTRGRRLRQGGWLLAGFATPLFITFLYFLSRGAWADFVYYTWTYNQTHYVPEISLAERLGTVRVPFALAWEYQPVVLIAGGVAGGWLVVRLLRAIRSGQPGRFVLLEWLIAGWCAAGLYACTLSGRGFTHYAIQLIPGLALACGWLTVRAHRALMQALGPTGGRIASALGCAVLAGLLVRPALARRQQMPLPQDASEQFARVVAAHSTAADRIHVWGYDAEIYAHARRLPATRFLYDTFLTGLIPWTNIDPGRDTAYAVVPGAWDAFFQDWRRQPPALVVDSRSLRGFLKYPLEAQAGLWPLVQRDYAEVDVAAARALGYRLFKRLDAPPPGFDGTALATDPAVTLTAPATSAGDEIRVAVRGGAGATKAGLMVDGRLVRLVACAPGRPAEAVFRLEPGLLPAGEHRLRAVAETSGIMTAAAEQTMRIGPEFADHTPPGGPALLLGGTSLRPLLSRQGEDGRPMPAAAENGRWNADAPSLLVYPLLPEMSTLTLCYGLSDAAFELPPDVGTDGIEAVVTMEEASGRTTRVFHRALGRQAAGSSRGLAVDQVSLPPHGPGRLLIALTPGPMNNPAYDWSFWRSLSANEPLLQLGPTAPAHLQVAPGLPRPAVFNRHDVTVVGAPAAVEFPATGDLTEIRGVYGLLDAAWTGAKKSPPVRFSIVLRTPGTPDRVVFARVLDPVGRAPDRGVREFSIKLPTLPAGTLHFATKPTDGGPTDLAFWSELQVSRLGALALHGPRGPILPGVGSSAQFGLGEIAEDGATRLFAHVTTRLVYPLPAGTTRLTGGFGILRAATADGQASDGATFIVELTAPGQAAREIWRQVLDPSHHPGDAGPHHLDLALPPWPDATLVLRTDPAPSGQINRAWSYWSDLRVNAP